MLLLLGFTAVVYPFELVGVIKLRSVYFNPCMGVVFMFSSVFLAVLLLELLDSSTC